MKASSESFASSDCEPGRCARDSLHADAKQIGEPAAARDIAERDAQHRRQRAKQRARRAPVACEIAANEPGRFAAAAGVQFEQAATFGRGIPDFGEGELKIAAEDVQIVVREEEAGRRP